MVLWYDDARRKGLSKEKYKRYCNGAFQQSYCIADIYKDETVKVIIQEKRKIWGIEEVI